MRHYFRLIKRYMSFRLGNKKLLFALLSTATVRTVLRLLIPIPVSMVVDYATEGKYQSAIWGVGLFIIISVCYSIFHHLNYIAYGKNAMYIHDTLQRKILDKVISLDPDYTKRISHAEIINTGFEDITKCQRIPDYLFDFLF